MNAVQMAKDRVLRGRTISPKISAPPHWATYTHPEGQTYFYLERSPSSFHVMTDAPISDPGLFSVGCTSGQKGQDVQTKDDNGGVIYNLNVTNVNTFHGPVNNVKHVENATFASTDGSRKYCTQRTEGGWHSTTSSQPRSEARRNPPNAFVLFCSGLARSQYGSEGVTVTDEEISEIVLATWRTMTRDDRWRVDQDAERADELHLAMLGSETMATKREAQRAKYWNFASRMTDFWLQRWYQTQATIRKLFHKLGKGLLMLPMDILPQGEASHTTFEPRSNTQNIHDGSDTDRETKRNPSRRPNKTSSQAPPAFVIAERPLGNLGEKKRHDMQDKPPQRDSGTAAF